MNIIIRIRNLKAHCQFPNTAGGKAERIPWLPDPASPCGASLTLLMNYRILDGAGIDLIPRFLLTLVGESS
jgi:hypothetical protein